MHPLVTTNWLADALGNPAVRVVDATWYLPTANADAAQEFEGAHIPGSVYLNISDVCDKTQSAPHMLPTADQFATQVGALGLGSDHTIIVYDKGEYAAARVWWMIRIFGHDKVAVLDGGLPKWLAEGRPTAAAAPTPAPAAFTPLPPDGLPRADLLRTMTAMQDNLSSGREQVVDARPPDRFAGRLPEIRAGVESGHIPDSINIFYESVIDSGTGLYRVPVEIETLFRDKGIDLDKPLVMTCGSGVSACQLALALHLTGRQNVPVYDGSWAEWGAVPENPKVTGD
jgi:thiosulfate/3-mercaptopyruvate sulfurtransferase